MFWLAVSITLLGCGTDPFSDKTGPSSGHTTFPSFPTKLCALQFEPKEFPMGTDGGTVTIEGTVEFFDPDGDVVTLRTLTQGPVRRTDQINDIDVQSLVLTAGTPEILCAEPGSLLEPRHLPSGATGRLPFFVTVSSNRPGNFFFILTARDGQGHLSNGLIGQFTITNPHR